MAATRGAAVAAGVTETADGTKERTGSLGVAERLLIGLRVFDGDTDGVWGIFAGTTWLWLFGLVVGVVVIAVGRREHRGRRSAAGVGDGASNGTEGEDRFELFFLKEENGS